jgi:hypothetical protein
VADGETVAVREEVRNGPRLVPLDDGRDNLRISKRNFWGR